MHCQNLQESDTNYEGDGGDASDICALYDLNQGGLQQFDLIANMRMYNKNKTISFTVTDYDNDIQDIFPSNIHL